MPSAKQRLTALAKELGACSTHWEMPICVSCDASAPMPGWAEVAMDDFMTGLLARLRSEDIRAVFAKIPAPTTERCRGCGGSRTCLTCTATYAQALFAALGLTRAERAALQTLMRQAREAEGSPPSA